jgi:hypothetical protein
MKIIACCLFAMAIALGACKRNPEIMQDPALVGQTVTLTGKVKKIDAPNLVQLDTNRGHVLVVTPEQNPLQLGDHVSVTGEVRRLTVAEFEQAYSVDANAPVEAIIQEENFVAASEIKPG